MNLNDYSRELQSQVERAENRLTEIIDTLAGPRPEKPAGVPPQEPGLIG